MISKGQTTQKCTEATNALRQGGLFATGGFAVVPNLVGASGVQSLLNEATENYVLADRQVSHTVDTAEARGGMPARSLSSGPGGTQLDSLYHSQWLQQCLSELCGARVRPTGARGTYSYYTMPGDFLDTHLDVHQCDVTLITALYDSTSPEDPGGGLAIFSNHINVPLSCVRHEDYRSSYFCKLEPGSSVVLLGGMVPHRVLPMSGHGERVISALCYEAY